MSTTCHNCDILFGELSTRNILSDFKFSETHIHLSSSTARLLPGKLLEYSAGEGYTIYDVDTEEKKDFKMHYLLITGPNDLYADVTVFFFPWTDRAAINIVSVGSFGDASGDAPSFSNFYTRMQNFCRILERSNNIDGFLWLSAPTPQTSHSTLPDAPSDASPHN